jgi:hypothetical protein
MRDKFEKKNKYKQYTVFFCRPHTICSVDMDFEFAEGCAIDGGTIAGEPSDLSLSKKKR